MALVKSLLKDSDGSTWLEAVERLIPCRLAEVLRDAQLPLSFEGFRNKRYCSGEIVRKLEHTLFGVAIPKIPELQELDKVK